MLENQKEFIQGVGSDDNWAYRSPGISEEELVDELNYTLTEKDIVEEQEAFRNLVKNELVPFLMEDFSNWEKKEFSPETDFKMINNQGKESLRKMKSLFSKILKFITDFQRGIKNQEKSVSENLISIFKQQLHQQERFIKTLSHDLSTPFTGIMGFSELLFDNDDSSFIETIQESAKLFTGILKARMPLLEDPSYDYHSLAEIIHSPDFEQVHTRAKGKEVKLNFELGNQRVFSDIERIELFLGNFINNAIKFVHEGIGEIKVTAEVIETGEVKISVIDNGVGISKATCERIQQMMNGEIEIGSQYSEEGTNGEEGTGKGLRNCMEYLSQMIGKMTVESVEGEGATFSVIVPATKEQHEFLSQQKEQPLNVVTQKVGGKVTDLLKVTAAIR